MRALVRATIIKVIVFLILGSVLVAEAGTLQVVRRIGVVCAVSEGLILAVWVISVCWRVAVGTATRFAARVVSSDDGEAVGFGFVGVVVDVLDKLLVVLPALVDFHFKLDFIDFVFILPLFPVRLQLSAQGGAFGGQDWVAALAAEDAVEVGVDFAVEFLQLMLAQLESAAALIARWRPGLGLGPGRLVPSQLLDAEFPVPLPLGHALSVFAIQELDELDTLVEQSLLRRAVPDVEVVQFPEVLGHESVGVLALDLQLESAELPREQAGVLLVAQFAQLGEEPVQLALPGLDLGGQGDAIDSLDFPLVLDQLVHL